MKLEDQPGVKTEAASEAQVNHDIGMIHAVAGEQLQCPRNLAERARVELVLG